MGVLWYLPGDILPPSLKLEISAGRIGKFRVSACGRRCLLEGVVRG